MPSPLELFETFEQLTMDGGAMAPLPPPEVEAILWDGDTAEAILWDDGTAIVWEL